MMPESRPDADDPTPGRDQNPPDEPVRRPGSRPLVDLITGPLGLILGIILLCCVCPSLPAVVWGGLILVVVLDPWITML